MSDQIQETPQTEVNPEQVENTVSAENVAQAPAPQGKGGKFKAVAKDCYYNRHKRSICMLCICVVLILLATFFGSMIQTAGWKYTVEDLRNASNKSKVSIQASSGYRSYSRIVQQPRNARIQRYRACAPRLCRTCNRLQYARSQHR